MASPEANSVPSSTPGLTLDASLVPAGGFSSREGLSRCLQVGEGDLHLFASLRAALFPAQSLAYAMWGPL